MSRIEAARARLAASRAASEGASGRPGWYEADEWPLRHQVHSEDVDHIAHHSPAAVEALRADLEAALVLAEAVQAWQHTHEDVELVADVALADALAAFEDGGKP